MIDRAVAGRANEWARSRLASSAASAEFCDDGSDTATSRGGDKGLKDSSAHRLSIDCIRYRLTSDSWRMLALPTCRLLFRPARPASGPYRAAVAGDSCAGSRGYRPIRCFIPPGVRSTPRKWIGGRNTIRFRMLRDDSRIQLDLYANLAVDRIVHGTVPLQYTRELNTVWVDFPETLRAGLTYTIDFHYSGNPREQGRFGGMSFEKDPAGRHWVFTASEDNGASIWWPNKDQWRDEVERMDISVDVPSDLMDVSNGLTGRADLGDGSRRAGMVGAVADQQYNVALNIGATSTCRPDRRRRSTTTSCPRT